MRAITIPQFGGPEVLTLSDIPEPVIGPNDVFVEVAAAGVNRADIGQRQGTYPPPPGAPDWPGMELSGTILAIGDDVTGWHAGDRVCALVPGGAYAERAAVDARLLMPVPSNVDVVDAAGIPEAAATVWANAVMAAGLTAEKSLLVHGGSSGIGSLAIQYARALGCTVFATAGSAEKVAFCENLGATGINYRDRDFVEVIQSISGGVDVVLDIVGGDYLQHNVEVLNTGGAIAIIANQSGAPGTFDIGTLMRKRGRIGATTLRARPIAERGEIIAAVDENMMPLFADGLMRTVTDTVFPLEQAADAHRRMQTSAHMGKILLGM
jgi:putative PIG3 family NAD(P)H quinone oxidoreductase